MPIVPDWEHRGRHLDIGGDRIFVVDLETVGPEPPVLVLHGFPTSSADWRPVADTLSADRRLVLLDFVGFGLSSKPDQAYSLFEQADVVAEVARRLGLEQVALVTHDMGDSVGGEILARSLDGALDFDVVARVVTNGSIYIDMAQLTDGQQLLLSLPDELAPEELRPGTDGLAAALRATLAPGNTVTDEELRAHAELIERDDGDRLLPRIIRYIGERREHEARWTGAIERHPSPLAVVWGDLDPIAVYPMAERLAAARPDARLVRLEGVGHYPMLEAPDEFGAAVRVALEG